jgi:glycerophosphoryl diester phosphodiesterase
MAMTSWETTPVYEGDRVVPYDFDWMLTPGAMIAIAAYADGIGPWLGMVVADTATRDNLRFTGLVAEAHAAGLVVHPYTFRADKSWVPPYAADFEDLLSIFLFRAKVDGVFTDFPDRAAAFLQKQTRNRP